MYGARCQHLPLPTSALQIPRQSLTHKPASLSAAALLPLRSHSQPGESGHCVLMA